MAQATLHQMATMAHQTSLVGVEEAQDQMGWAMPEGQDSKMEKAEPR